MSSETDPQKILTYQPMRLPRFPNSIRIDDGELVSVSGRAHWKTETKAHRPNRKIFCDLHIILAMAKARAVRKRPRYDFAFEGIGYYLSPIS